jgi:2,4-dienoyl-CoA reductase-like NADH-dependent reductase (Old Yellow Enzyme family)
VTDWVDGGLTVDDGIAIAAAYKEAGAAYICCSSGGNSPQQKIPTGPGHQVHLSDVVRKVTGGITRSVGPIDTPQQADDIIRSGQADVVALGRAFLADPRWPWRAGEALGHDVQKVRQYARSAATIKKWVLAG